MSAFPPRVLFLLDNACKPITEAFDQHPYLVGSAQEGKANYRDVDIRLILKDEKFDALLNAIGKKGITLMSLTFGQYLAACTGLPIDFQIQRDSIIKDKYKGNRNPLGVRDLSDFVGQDV